MQVMMNCLGSVLPRKPKQARLPRKRLHSPVGYLMKMTTHSLVPLKKLQQKQQNQRKKQSQKQHLLQKIFFWTMRMTVPPFSFPFPCFTLLIQPSDPLFGPTKTAAKKEEPKKEVKKEEPKKEEIKKEEPKKTEPVVAKKEEPKKSTFELEDDLFGDSIPSTKKESKKEEPKKEEAKKEEPVVKKQATPKRSTVEDDFFNDVLPTKSESSGFLDLPEGDDSTTDSFQPPPPSFGMEPEPKTKTKKAGAGSKIAQLQQNLNLKVDAMLPGAAPQIKREVADDFSDSEEDDKEFTGSAIKRESKSKTTDPGTLQHMTKERPMMSGKRRPTRKARSTATTSLPSSTQTSLAVKSSAPAPASSFSDDLFGSSFTSAPAKKETPAPAPTVVDKQEKAATPAKQEKATSSTSKKETNPPKDDFDLLFDLPTKSTSKDTKLDEDKKSTKAAAPKEASKPATKSAATVDLDDIFGD